MSYVRLALLLVKAVLDEPERRRVGALFPVAEDDLALEGLLALAEVELQLVPHADYLLDGSLGALLGWCRQRSVSRGVVRVRR